MPAVVLQVFGENKISETFLLVFLGALLEFRLLMFLVDNLYNL